MTTEEHPFATFIRTIGKGKTGRRSLTQDEAKAAMTMLLNGKIEPVQLGAFLMVLRVKEESAEEIAGFVYACRKQIQNNINMVIDKPDLDWPSYAGKKRQPPWFLLSALLLAQSGYKIIMHGSSGHTVNRLYTENVLTDLGLVIANNWQQVSEQLAQHNFSYLPIQQLCPQLHTIIELRPLLGLRSPVHTLSRLLNPLAANATLQSVFHPSYIETHHQAALLLGEKNAAVFKGEGGEIEYRPHADVAISAISNNTSEQYTIKRTTEAPIETEVNSAMLTALWEEKISNTHAVSAVIGTAAIALKTMGVEQDIETARQLATELWHKRASTLFAGS